MGVQLRVSGAAGAMTKRRDDQPLATKYLASVGAAARERRLAFQVPQGRRDSLVMCATHQVHGVLVRDTEQDRNGLRRTERQVKPCGARRPARAAQRISALGINAAQQRPEVLVVDATVELDAARITPYVSWGTNPGQVVPIDAVVPDPSRIDDAGQRNAAERAIAYMDLVPGTPMRDVPVDVVFLGSCTNSRIEDLRLAASVIQGKSVATGVQAYVVPGSMRVKEQAEREGLDLIFRSAGFEWRSAGCSMCLGMNPDQLLPGQRCASTSNRNFEGRQGKGGRTHLVSPAVAAATAILGTFATPADLR